MPNWVAIVLRPLVLVSLLFAAMYVSRLLERVIPEGRVKRLLYAKHEVVPRDINTVPLRTQRICTAILVILALLIIFKPFRYFVP
jgi:hypothetical protein